MDDSSILADALAGAARGGDPRPSSVSSVRTVSNAATSLLAGYQDKVVGDDTSPVVVVQVTGEFTSMPLPAGPNRGERMSGKALVSVYDAETGDVIASGFRVEPIDLGTFGDVVLLYSG